jgi:hypothetical protein
MALKASHVNFNRLKDYSFISFYKYKKNKSLYQKVKGKKSNHSTCFIHWKKNTKETHLCNPIQFTLMFLLKMLLIWLTINLFFRKEPKKYMIKHYLYSVFFIQTFNLNLAKKFIWKRKVLNNTYKVHVGKWTVFTLF